LELFDTGQPFPNKAVGWCNVKDVAEAHINAYENASASGRYLLAERVAHYSELASILHDMYPSLKISDK
jgi:nucleoside-diphosphate-sugar epimerase